MKSYLFLTSLLLLALVTQAQTSQGYLASYDLTFNNSRPSVITSDLYIESSQEQTLSIWRRDTRRSLKEELPDPIKDSGNEFRVTVGTGKNRYHYYDSKKDSIYSIVSIFRDRFVIHEAKPTIAWDLSHKEVKTIGDYTAKKATCYFRGRNYTASGIT